LRVFQNRALRTTFREEVAGVWRRLHNEELHNFYASPNIIRVIKSRRMKSAGHVARMAKTRNRLIGWEGVDWMHLTQDRYQWRALVKTEMNIWVP